MESSGLLRIGFITVWENEIVPNIVRQFRKLNPEVEFSLLAIFSRRSRYRCWRPVRSTLDFFVCRSASSRLSRFDSASRTLAVLVPSSHKLAKRKRVRLRELAGENFVMNERTYAPGFHDLIFGILRDARIASQCFPDRGDIPTLISLVDAHMGITIFPYRQ